MEEDKLMTHTDLILQIRDIIKNISHKEYTKPIYVKDLEPQGYAVGFETHQYYPSWYSAELPDDEFLKFIENELRQAKFVKADYHKAVRNTTLDHPLNNLRSPYDIARAIGKD